MFLLGFGCGNAVTPDDNDFEPKISESNIHPSWFGVLKSALIHSRTIEFIFKVLHMPSTLLLQCTIAIRSYHKRASLILGPEEHLPMFALILLHRPWRRAADHRIATPAAALFRLGSRGRRP